MSSNRSYYSSAPLPSPTTTVPQHFYFPPTTSRQPSFTSSLSTTGQQVPQPSQSIPKTQATATAQTSSSQNQGSMAQPSQSHDSNDPLRRDFGLLAEAARRAQVAVLTRDLGDVGL